MNLLGNLDPHRIMNTVEKVEGLMTDLIAAIDRNTEAQEKVAQRLAEMADPV
jgi:hypothetical protein